MHIVQKQLNHEEFVAFCKFKEFDLAKNISSVTWSRSHAMFEFMQKRDRFAQICPGIFSCFSKEKITQHSLYIQLCFTNTFRCRFSNLSKCLKDTFAQSLSCDFPQKICFFESANHSNTLNSLRIPFHPSFSHKKLCRMFI